MTLYREGVARASAISNEDGYYEVLVTEVGDYVVIARKEGFKEQTQGITVTGIGPEYAVRCDFRGTQALVPNDPDIWYVLGCIALWKYPPAHPEDALNIWKILEVIAAWKY